MIVSSMFYTRREHTARVGYWCKDCHQPPLTPFLTHYRFNDWSWSEFQVSLPPQTLTYDMLQLKLSPVSSALEPCTSEPRDSSHGNGMIKTNILHIHQLFSRLMIITGILTLFAAITFMRAVSTSSDLRLFTDKQVPVSRLTDKCVVFDGG